jgi:hypothetical protein
VQAPADAATGSVPVAVTNCAGTSTPVAAQKAALAAGILAPASFNVAGKQYAVAQFADLVFVGNPNLIAGAAFRPAKPGVARSPFAEIQDKWILFYRPVVECCSAIRRCGKLAVAVILWS